MVREISVFMFLILVQILQGKYGTLGVHCAPSYIVISLLNNILIIFQILDFQY